MIHDIVLPAVLRKAKTEPLDTLIANTEMTACIGYIYNHCGINDVPEFDTPEELYDSFMNKIDSLNADTIDKTCQKMIDMLKEYHVLPMKNETLNDLKLIITNIMNNKKD